MCCIDRQNAELDRDLRTVIVVHLHPKVTEHMLWDWFTEKVGKLADARIITDRVTRKSKGYRCFVAIALLNVCVCGPFVGGIVLFRRINFGFRFRYLMFLVFSFSFFVVVVSRQYRLH